MMLAVGVGACAVLFAVGVPLYVAFGLGGLIILMFHSGLSLEQLAMMFFGSLDSFVLLAGALFILAGNLMLQGGIGKPLVDFLGSFTARVPGGLGIASVLACLFIGALTGVIPATLAAVGIIMFPAMIAAGYPRGFSGGVLCASSNLGNLIPPSIGFILFGFLTNASVGKLFIAGIMPGVLLAAAFAITTIVIAKREKFPSMPAVSLKERGSLFVKALPGIFMPIIILGGIYGGIFTPTEAAAVACVYCFIVGAIINRGINWKATWASLTDTVRIVTFILILIAGAMVLGKAFMLVGFTQAITNWVTAAGLGPMGFLLLLVVVFIAVTFIMDATAMMFVVIPLIMPTVAALDINLIHLGVIFVVAASVGVTTPPMSVHLYVTAGMFDVPVEEVMRGVLPFLAVLTIVLFIIVLFPEISTWLPGTMMGG